MIRLALSQALDPAGVVGGLHQLLVAADAQGALKYIDEKMGQYEDAEAPYYKVLPVFQELGDRHGTLYYHFRLAEVAFLRGNSHKTRHWVVGSRYKRPHNKSIPRAMAENQPVGFSARMVLIWSGPKVTYRIILAEGAVQTVRPPRPLSFEISGQLTTVEVSAGDQIQAGAVLARLEADDSIASLEAAVASAALNVLHAQQTLDDICDNAATMTAQAQMNLAQAQEALQRAEYRWQVQQEGFRASGDTIAAAEANLVLAEREVEQAQAEYNRYSGRDEDDPLRALALSNLVAAKQRRDSILRGLNWYTGSPSEIAQARLDAEVAMAQAQLEAAEREWTALRDGPDPDQVAIAEGELASAQAQLTRAEDDLQKALTGETLLAPVDGTVLSVEAAPGTRVTPGTPILILLDTTQFEFHTTNLSERDVAQVRPGQKAAVILKAYPSETIEGTVVRIGWQVGQIIGDAATFPVMLSLNPTGQIIRPGMTGRVEIRVNTQ